MSDKKNLKKLKFLQSYEGYDTDQLLKELLYYQKTQIEKLEKVRSNTSTLVWWLVAIPIIFGILFFIL
ncbi:MAG: hypothetical protein CMC76_12255 [Flavobacteriaceae bacterium]|nr:hypothetical protein [Flavobacteriaceae bacterium]|tara:strand:- start:1683 stop:1886 length:204 start_codon:yes stop_codon:yes gene_type:complete